MDLVLILSFFILGLATFFSPCIAPLVPGFIAYLLRGYNEGLRYTALAGLLFSLGVFTFVTLIGLTFLSLGLLLAAMVPIVKILASLVVLSMGVVMLLRSRGLSFKMKYLSVKLMSRVLSFYLYGLIYGPFALTCSLPIFIALFSMPLSTGVFVDGLIAYFAFGLGISIPFIVVSLLTHEVRGRLSRFFVERRELIDRLSGVVLVLLGLYLFISSCLG